MRLLTMVVATGLLGLVALPFSGAGVAQEDRTGQAPRAEGLVLARCSACHTTDLIMQQRLDHARWETTVRKMIHWGAELSEEEAGLLVKFLAARFHPNAPAVVALSDAGPAGPLEANVPQTQGMPSGVPQHGAAVFANYCQACHGFGASGGAGPKLAGNPILSMDTVFWETTLHGRGAMPAWEHVLSRQDIADVHAWLKSL